MMQFFASFEGFYAKPFLKPYKEVKDKIVWVICNA